MPCELLKLRNPYVNRRICRWIVLFLKRQNPLESMSRGLQRQELRKQSNFISGANGLTRMPKRLKARTPMLKPTACLLHDIGSSRSEEHTSELQSRPHLVCRLLLEKKKRLLCRHGLSALCGAAS